MIKEINLKNFQSHKSSRLKLHPGVNVIIGKTDSGKTSIMRALKWVVTNRPKGDSFRSDWGGNTSVSVLTNDYSVERLKTERANQYKLREENEDPKEGLEFNAIGLAVPEEIEAVLNMNEINLQSQFDQPFLLNDTPGAVASHFNKIAHLERIDTSTGAIKKWIGKINQIINTDKASLVDSKEELESYSYLEKFEVQIEVLETMENTKLRTTNSRIKLQKVVKDAGETQIKIDTNALILSAEGPVNKILAFYTEKESITIQKQKLVRLLRENEEFVKELKEEEDIMEMEEIVSTLLLLYEKKNALKKEFLTIGVLVDNIKVTERNVRANNIQLKNREERFKAEMPETCPLCNQKIRK